ncbi:MAG: hypothetical protein WBB67_08660 [bacterium]
MKAVGMKIHLDIVDNVVGFTISNAREGEQVRILPKAAITSDEQEFYLYIEQIAASFLNKNNIPSDSVYQFLIIIHQDLSADLYINDFQAIAEIMSKKDIIEGDLARECDIADIKSLKFPEVKIIETDKIVYCFKVGWKFGLFFDLDRRQPLDLDDLYLRIGILYRYLRFQYVYNLIEKEPHYGEMVKDGWFPFVSLLGSEFRSLIELYKNKFDFNSKIDRFVDTFDKARLDRIINKWWNKEIFKEKQSILQAGIDSFLEKSDKGHINCIKNLYSEIDGIIRILYFRDSDKDERITTQKMLGYILKRAREKSGDDLSLLLPYKFFEYLKDIAFADFDLEKGKIDLSRHSTSHGVASAESYTKMKALQAILILDQIYFYI